MTGRSRKKKYSPYPLLIGGVLLFLFVCFATPYTRHKIGSAVWELCSCGRVASVLGVDTAERHFALGEYFFSANSNYDIRAAQRHYQAALSLEPTLRGAHYQLGRTYFIVGDFERAYAEILREEELYPDFGKVHYMKGLIAGYMKNFLDAEQEFAKFIETDSRNWAGYNDLSWIYFAQGNYHYAEATAREGLIHAPENPWLHNAVGVALLAQERGSEALPHFFIAQNGFGNMSAAEWGESYPGNSPGEHTDGLAASLGAVERNIQRAQSQSAQ